MRKFLVIMDDSDEWVTALRFAATRARRTNGGVEVLAVIAPDEFQHWIGVGEVMRAEAREAIEERFGHYQERMRQVDDMEAELVIREGDRVQEILAQIEEDREIGILVLAASDGDGGPGPLINQLVGRLSHQMRVPITVVPGHMTLDQIRSVC